MVLPEAGKLWSFRLNDSARTFPSEAGTVVSRVIAMASSTPSKRTARSLPATSSLLGQVLPAQVAVLLSPVLLAKVVIRSASSKRSARLGVASAGLVGVDSAVMWPV